MRSNIARTWVSSRVPGAAGPGSDPRVPGGADPAPVPTATVTLPGLLQLGEEVDQVLELLRVLLGEALERRHRGRRVDQRRGDRGRSQLGADLCQRRAR